MEKKTISIRLPVELLHWIDFYARIASINQQKSITRNHVIVEFLEAMKEFQSSQKIPI